MQQSCLNFSTALAQLIQDAVLMAKKKECEIMLAKFPDGNFPVQPTLAKLPEVIGVIPPIEDVEVIKTDAQTGEMEIVLKPAGKRKEKTEPKVEVKDEISAEQVKKACSALAAKIHDKEKVINIIKAFGVSKVDELTQEQRIAALKALEAAGETTTQKGENQEGY